MHLVGTLTVVAYLWIQSTGALMATFAGIVLIAASLGTKDVEGHPEGDFGGFLTILLGALVIW